jgi:hypothetical protein
VKDEMAMRLLRATRKQLRGKPTRKVQPFKVAEEAGINPYAYEYETVLRYLLGHGYIDPNPSPGLYRVTNKGLEEILSSP